MVRWLRRQESMNYQRSYLAWCQGYTSFIDSGGGRKSQDTEGKDTSWNLDAAEESNTEQALVSGTDSALPSILDISAISLPQSRRYCISGKPNFHHQSFQDIEARYNVVDFYWYFHYYFKQIPGQQIDSQYKDGEMGLDIWNSFWLSTPQLQDVSAPSLWHKVSASPPHEKKNHLHTHKVPGTYSTVLVVSDPNAEGIKSTSPQSSTKEHNTD
jgi:hypothetical protein